MSLDQLTLPVKSMALSDYLPHRDPMLWVDEVVLADKTGGVCHIIVDTTKHYCDHFGNLRSSAFIEWMAQSCGLIQAFIKASSKDLSLGPTQTYLVGVGHFKTFFSLQNTIMHGDLLEVVIKNKYDLTPFYIIEGQVRSPQRKEVYAIAELKLFAR